MAKNDQEDMFEKLMASNLARTVEFIKFAETKNAALLTFCSAWILGIVSLSSSDKAIPRSIDDGMKLAFFLFALAATIAIQSFLPRLSVRPRTSKEKRKNLLYFGDIATFSADAFAILARDRYLPDADHTVTEDYMADLSEQLTVNSQIALRKMRLFSWGARLVLLAVFMLAAPTIGQFI